jgi:hypothetical protein
LSTFPAGIRGIFSARGCMLPNHSLNRDASPAALRAVRRRAG